MNSVSNTNPCSREQTFLIESATMLHRFGTPSHRLERVMTQVSRTLGVEGVFLYTPTALLISLSDEHGNPQLTLVRRVDSGPFDVDKLIQFDDLLGRVERSETSVEKATVALHRIAGAKSLYASPTYAVACAVACASVAVFFGGSWHDVIAAGAVGLLVTCIELLHQRFHLETGLLEPIAGMSAAMASLLIACYFVPIDDRLVTLAGLIVLIPGLRITVALTELAVGHLSAGVARLAGAIVSLSTLFIGVALVWRLAAGMRQAAAANPLPEYFQWIALVVAPVSFAIVFRAGLKQWPVIALVSILGVLTSRLLEPLYGIEVASFFGSLTVGCVSNLYARIRDRPALIALTPGMLILVPGALGYQSLVAVLEKQTVEGMQFAFAMFLIGAALVGGLLVSNAVVPPKRIL
ncbi:MAG: threonine/serine exporter ThrE family protein [Rubripirellula sp.]